MNFLDQFLAPHVERQLVLDEGEVIVDQIRRHWVASALPVLEVLVGTLIFFGMPQIPYLWFIPLFAGLFVGGYGFYQIQANFMDRFVVTNIRVFRVHGVFNRQLATVPISRILDITVKQPFWGRILGYGHFVFESAAQVQGLKDIMYVPQVEQRNLTIQRVIQRSGARSKASVATDSDDGT